MRLKATTMESSAMTGGIQIWPPCLRRSLNVRSSKCCFLSLLTAKVAAFLAMFSLITSPAECFSFKCHPLITDWCDLTQRESASRSVSSPRLEGLSLVCVCACVCVWLGSSRHHSVLKKTKSGPLTFRANMSILPGSNTNTVFLWQIQ